MQQTNKYELNKPGLDDPVAIAPLNENADKIEAALIAEAKSRADADAAESSARTAAIQTETNTRTAAIQAEAAARASALSTEATNRANGDKAEANARTAAIQAEANTRASADTTETNARIAAVNAEAAARTNADNALSARIQAIEAKRFAYGVYNATVDTITVNLGFTPVLVIVHYIAPSSTTTFMAVRDGQPSYAKLIIINGGFQYTLKAYGTVEYGYYTYAAFG